MSPAADADDGPGRAPRPAATGAGDPPVGRTIMDENEKLVETAAGLLTAAFDIKMMPSHRTERRDSLAGRRPRLPVLIVPGFMSSGLVVERSAIKRSWEGKRLWLNLVSLGLGGLVGTDRPGVPADGARPPSGSSEASSGEEGGPQVRRRPDPPGTRSSARGGSRRESFASTLRRASVRAADEASGGDPDGDGLDPPPVPPGDGDDDAEAKRRTEEGAAGRTEVQSRNTWIKHIR